MSDELLKRLETGHDKECAMSYGMHEHCCDCSYPARQEAAARVRELEAERDALRAENERLRALLMRVRERGLNAPLDSAIEDALGGAPPRDDTARLDWLDAHWHSAFVAKTERGYLPWRDGTDYVVGLREAIDAARGDGNDD